MAVKVDGLRDTIRRLEQLGADLDELKDVMGRISTAASTVMRGFIPNRSGRLRSSARPNRAKAKAVVMVGRARVPYAGVINYGYARRNIRPANFVARTDQVMEDRATQMLEQGISDLVKRRNLR